MTYFKWDGSFLGEFKRDVILETRIANKDIYWHLRLQNEEVYALSKPVKDSFACVCDELKIVFGLPKLGSHLIKFGKALFLLIRVPIKDGSIISELTLADVDKESNVHKNILFRQQVQETFAFREILGLTQSFENSIRIRVPKNGLYYPVSFSEKSNQLDKEKPTLPKTVHEKWFAELKNGITDVIKRLLCMPIDSDTEVVTVIARYRKKIEDTITRVDKEYIWMSVYIIERIMKHLY